MLHDFLKDQARRRRNQRMLSLLDHRICPSCSEEAITPTSATSWECFRCQETFGAQYSLTSLMQKPVTYRDSAVIDLSVSEPAIVVPFPPSFNQAA